MNSKGLQLQQFVDHLIGPEVKNGSKRGAFKSSAGGNNRPRAELGWFGFFAGYRSFKNGLLASTMTSPNAAVAELRSYGLNSQ